MTTQDFCKFSCAFTLSSVPANKTNLQVKTPTGKYDDRGKKRHRAKTDNNNNTQNTKANRQTVSAVHLDHQKTLKYTSFKSTKVHNYWERLPEADTGAAWTGMMCGSNQVFKVQGKNQQRIIKSTASSNPHMWWAIPLRGFGLIGTCVVRKVSKDGCVPFWAGTTSYTMFFSLRKCGTIL